MPDPHVFEQDPHGPQVLHMQCTENDVYILFSELHPFNFSLTWAALRIT